ncbi:MAG TPA: type II toxin-antitoxin system PemK/MazF family toxin [Ignavibacteria bacterium]|nr:type II toxin-antitoxin system PemK/MazF family toxin [Ignavibacteria bacterium]
MKKGDIVLIPFPFTNLKGVKKRPAVILYKGNFDIIVTFITTKLKWSEQTDILLEPDKINRLKKSSLIRTNKLATLEIESIIGKIGELKKETLEQLDSKLKEILGLK